MKTKVDNRKPLGDFTDSSEDESIVVKDPYPDVSRVTSKEIKKEATLNHLTNIQTQEKILNRTAKTHQYLLRKHAVPGTKQRTKKNREPSYFPATLTDVKKMLDAVPSNAATQEDCPKSIVPSFRGLKWKKNIKPKDLFFSTRVDWKDDHSYASTVFNMTDIDINVHTKAFFFKDESLPKKYKGYNLDEFKCKNTRHKRNNDNLQNSAEALQEFFKLADNISKPFKDWKEIFGDNLRNAAKLEKKNLSLAEILCFIYVNSYDRFQDIFSNLSDYLNKMGDNRSVKTIKKCWIEMDLSSEQLESSVPYLSEGQIPRHALLYAFGMKEYTKGVKPPTNPLFSEEFKPVDKVYLGKLLVMNNSHTLFSGENKAKSIPEWDSIYGGGVISKVIIGEKEIQHQAVTEGKTDSSINIKLPKFHHKKAPKRYIDKYGIDSDLYLNFKKTFVYLHEKDEYKKLSWMYLESVLLAHLIQFHEIQLFKYCNHMAEDVDKKIKWFDRSDKAISNPFRT